VNEDIPVRLGFSRKWDYLIDPVTGNTVDEWGFSVGSGVPLPSKSGRIDISLEYRKRGNLPENILKESGIVLNLGFTANEIWSRKYGD
jgi:hypothetical protein